MQPEWIFLTGDRAGSCISILHWSFTMVVILKGGHREKNIAPVEHIIIRYMMGKSVHRVVSIYEWSFLDCKMRQMSILEMHCRFFWKVAFFDKKVLCLKDCIEYLCRLSVVIKSKWHPQAMITAENYLDKLKVLNFQSLLNIQGIQSQNHFPIIVWCDHHCVSKCTEGS